MASEDSGRPVRSSIPPATVHLRGQGQEALKALLLKVLSTLHRPDDLSEGLELQTLLTEDGMALEKRDNVASQNSPLSSRPAFPAGCPA